MRAVIQRVTKSSVSVGGEVKGAVGAGFNVLLGVMKGDDESDAEILAYKIARLRVFEDEAGKMNKSVVEIGGEILVISQFTLCADVKKGNRPSFTPAAEPAEAERLYEYFCSKLLENGVSGVATGVFSAYMKVEIENDGPATIIMDSDVWNKKN